MLVTQINRLTLHLIFQKILTLQAVTWQIALIKLWIQHRTVRIPRHKIVLMEILQITVRVMILILPTTILLTIIFINSITAVLTKVFSAYINFQQNTNLWIFAILSLVLNKIYDFWLDLWWSSIILFFITIIYAI